MSQQFPALLQEIQSRGIDPTQLDDLVHEAAAEQASAINNGGLEEQLAYLCAVLGDQAAEAIREHLGDLEVPAEVHSDDRVHEVKFDAAPYLRQCDDADIAALVECGWGGDYPADEVAEFFAQKNLEIGALFDYLHRIRDRRSHKDSCGFECHLDTEAAEAWVRRNRPHLADLLDKDC